MKKIQLIALTLLFAVNITFANNNLNQQKQIQNTIYKVIYKVNEFSVAKYPNAVMQGLVQQEILPLFDFDHMSRSILENVPSGNTKQFLISRVKQDIATTIMQSLAKAKGRIFTPVGIQTINNNIILQLRVKRIVIDLAIHNTRGVWKIFDVALNNQSLINYYKQLAFKNKI